MPDLIIAENKNPIRQDIITQTEGYNVSERYVPIATQQVIDTIKDYSGVEPRIIGFNNANVRKPEKNGFQRHAVMLQFPDAMMLDGTKMNMILFNSNDRSTALKIHMGALRMACSNQMVWGDEIAEPVSLRHTKKDWKESIYTLMDAYAETQRKTQEMIDNMMNRYVSYGDMGRFAERVTEEIINVDITGHLLDPLQLNDAHRKEDVGKNLWLLFNRVQYNTINGGVDRIIDKTDEDGILFETVSKTHKMTDEAKKIKVNKKLHSMALEML